MIDGVDTNVALESNGATAAQSRETAYPASKAIDGYTNATDSDLASTGAGTDPWW